MESPVLVAVVRIMVDDLSGRFSQDHELEQRYLEGDDQIEQQSLGIACMLAGIEPQEYLLALASDGNLLQLHRCAVTEAICGTTDPGPYDRISPELPT